MATTPAEQASAENIRLVIAQQNTVQGSIQALLRAVSGVIHKGVAGGDPTALEAFADHIDADPKSWSDAVMANTALARETVMPISNVPPDVQYAFTSHAQEEQQKADDAQKPHDEHPQNKDKAQQPHQAAHDKR